MRISRPFGTAWRKAGTAIGVSATVGALTVALSGTAGAAVLHRPSFARGADHAVFVQTDNTSGNQVVAYHRAPNGTLTLAEAYNTGGLGGQLAGSVVDHLASQGSLQYDPLHAAVYAVNAGSNTVSVFAARGDRLFLREVIGSGGTFPVSIAVHGNLVYVLNALDGGSVQGYRAAFGRLIPIPGSTRLLGLDPTATPQFTNTPGQVAFSPDGSQLIVTTKANGSNIDVFGVGANGRLQADPTVNSEPGTVPFAITFDRDGHLVIANAGTNAVATFALHPDGTVTPLDSVGTGQAATCWVVRDGHLLFASNAGSANVSGYASSRTGALTLLGQTPTDPGTVDAAVAPGGRYLYVQAGGIGSLDEFRVSRAGSLTEIGSVNVPAAVGGEGISAA